MVPNSPTDALGRQADGVRHLMIEVVRDMHDRYAAGHVATGSKYAIGFGAQWRDLLDAAHDALTDRGFQAHKLPPGGHKVGVVNGCLVYVWRVPDSPKAVRNFADSPTRLNGFAAPTPPPMLWDPSFSDAGEEIEALSDLRETESTTHMMTAIDEPMPVVLVMVHSVPSQLQSIEWAVAELDSDSKVQLHGRQIIWESESATENATAVVESFDAGIPAVPTLEPRIQERPGPNA